MPPGLALAVELAALGWHVFPLSPASKRPLANCPACTSHDPASCPCLTAGRWCHGVRAAPPTLPGSPPGGATNPPPSPASQPTPPAWSSSTSTPTTTSSPPTWPPKITGRLTSAGTAAGLTPAHARRIVTQSFANGIARPLTPPPPDAHGITGRARTNGTNQPVNPP